MITDDELGEKTQGLRFLCFFFTFILTLLAPHLIFAQLSGGSHNPHAGLTINSSSIEGSTKLSSQWFSGYCLYSNGNKSSKYLLNYDLASNQLLYKSADGQTMIAKDSDLSGFKWIIEDDQVWVFRKTSLLDFENGHKPRMNYIRMYDSPWQNILIEYLLKLDDPNDLGYSHNRSNVLNAKYAIEPNYFILTPKGNYQKVKLNDKSLLKVYGFIPELKEFLNSNEIKTLEDLETAVKFIDEKVMKR